MRKNTILRFCLVLILAFSGIALISAQEISEKRDIAIFKLSYFDLGIPNEILGSVDAEIRNVFVNLGRFNVMAMTYQLGTNNVQDFVNKIKSYKKDNVDIPEEVAMGQEIFTYEDLEQLISSFIVIIPSVVYFDVRVDRDEEDLFLGFDITMKTSFSILNVDTMLLEKEILIETSGYDEDRDTAMLEAVDSITGSLAFEIKSVPIFTLKTGVLDSYNGGITLQMGNDMGIRRGFEFVVLEEQVLPSGHKRSREAGLVLVNTVDEEISEATVLYGDPQPGDQLKEIPRAGFEAEVYLHALLNGMGTTNQTITYLPGIRTTMSLGFYNVRPFIGFEVPIVVTDDPGFNYFSTMLLAYGIPLSAYIGGEYTFYMKRLQLSAAVAAGASGIALYEETDVNNDGESDPFVATHVGGKAYVSLTYLVSRDFKITFDAGYGLWMGLDEAYYDYTGILAGIGGIVKL